MQPTRKKSRPASNEHITPRLRGKLRYIIFHKPFGVLSQFTADQPGQRTLAEFGFPEGVYPVGRLDLDSEGLLLLTNDGSLVDAVLKPGTGHRRKYAVHVEGEVTEEALLALRLGVDIGVDISGYRTLPAQARRLPVADFPPRVPPIRSRKSIPDSWIELELVEGKNRQVRRMTAAVGFPTLRLLRTAIGPIRIEGLLPGHWRDLSEQEVLTLRAHRA